MKNYSFLRIWEMSALVSLCIVLCCCAWAQGRHGVLQEEVLRMHVLAVSDSEYEQQLKLRVRDSVLSFMGPMLQGIVRADDAEKVVRENLQSIADAAYAAAEGRQVTVSIGEQSYPSREYEGGSLPAGRYKALKIVLGEGEGQNWWCVVYPSLKENTDLKIVGDEKIFKFKILELWGELIN